jgi:ubiquinone/menaquinone biosynthesis C-methylase UbiE
MAARGASQAFFDLWSRTYDNPLLQALTYRPLQDAVLRGLRPHRPERVLDVGCGTGRLTARLASELGATAVGCDYSAGMLEKARERTQRPAWVQGDAMALPVRSGSFDAVVCTESFHWYPDQPRAVRELARVLRPGGRLLVVLINPRNEYTTELTHRWSERMGQPFTWPTPARMRSMVTGAGLRVLRQDRVWRMPAGILLPPVLTVAERPLSA